MIYTTILFSVAFVIIVLLGVFLYLIKTKKIEPRTDYRAFFIMGIIWLGAGIPLKNYTLMVTGAIFTIIGLANKNKWGEVKKWDELNPLERKLKLAALIILSILVILGLVVYLWFDYQTNT